MRTPSPESAAGVSLWLVPSGGARRRLADLIAALAGRHRGPRFEPHATLLGEVRRPAAEVVAAAAKLAAETSPLALRVDGIGGRDEYFRCLYLRLEKTPALLDAHRRARALFARETDPPFLPHVSLFYGRLERAKRERLASALAGYPAAFEVRALAVQATEGPPAAWRRLARFRLGASRRPSDGRVRGGAGRARGRGGEKG